MNSHYGFVLGGVFREVGAPAGGGRCQSSGHDGGLINGGSVRRFCVTEPNVRKRCLSSSSSSSSSLSSSSVRRLFATSNLRAAASAPPQPPHPSLPPPSPHPPIKTAGCWSGHIRTAGAAGTGRSLVSYPLHGRQRSDRNARCGPLHSIRASDGRRLRASLRSSPVSSLPHPLPPSAVGAARCVKLRREKPITSGWRFQNKNRGARKGFHQRFVGTTEKDAAREQGRKQIMNIGCVGFYTSFQIKTVSEEK